MPGKRVKVEVTERDIKRGVRGSLISCPIAIAVRRAAKSRQVFAGCRLQAYPRAMRVDPFRVDTPAKARKWMLAFDAGKPVKPFSFTVRI